MVTQPSSDGGRDFVTIFKTGSVDRDEYPELAEHLLEGRIQLAAGTGYLMKFGEPIRPSTRNRASGGDVVRIEVQSGIDSAISIERPMTGSIGRVFHFSQQQCPEHRFERLRIVPLRERILPTVSATIQAANHFDRVDRLIDDLPGLPGQRGPSTGERTNILETLVD